jgi:hypothetical protein
MASPCVQSLLFAQNSCFKEAWSNHSQKHLKLKDRSVKAQSDTEDKDDDGGLQGYVDGVFCST